MRADRIVEVLLAAIAAVMSALVLSASTTWPTAAVIAGGLVVGVLVGAIGRAIAAPAGSVRRPALFGRVVVGVAVGAVLGELAAMVVFSGPIDAELTRQASPRTELAEIAVAQARQARSGLDDAVVQAEQRRDEALVVARCEVNPAEDCPQSRITGRPGSGPGARTAEDFLRDAGRTLDAAIAERDTRSTALDAAVDEKERALDSARDAQLTGGIGARWQAMNAYTLDHPGPLVLRSLIAALCALLMVVPLLMARWRPATTQEAESAADTAVAVKRAEVRAQVDQLWAEQELTSARMAIEAQNAIDAERQRRRVAEALEEPAPEPLPVIAQRVDEPVSAELEPHRGGGIPLLPDVTRAAARFIKPFVPPVVSGAIAGATQLAAAPIRRVIEETEEFHFTMRRTHRVTVESASDPASDSVGDADAGRPRIESQRGVVLEGTVDGLQIEQFGGPRQLPPA